MVVMVVVEGTSYFEGTSSFGLYYTAKFKKHIKAEHGVHGSSNLKTGSQGKDVYIDVPLGTIER